MMDKVATAEAARFIEDCLKAAGANTKAAQQQADLLIQADRLGHPSHGLNRLEYYVYDIQNGVCSPNAEPKILKETVSTAWVDANSVLGATSSHFAMDLAIKKAKQTGIGGVSVKALGTNPIAVVAPASKGETFYLDMATTAVAAGKIEMQRRKGEPLPSGWALGPDGKETHDADLAFNIACLMPLGGGESTSGYKGYGLAAMVELFCGISSGSKYGHHVQSWSYTGDGGPADLSHCFMALDPGCFAPGFGDRLADSIQQWRNLEPTDPSLPVLSPGDKEKKAAAEIEARGTISYVTQQIESSAALAERLGVKPMDVQ